jgi:hypothetical protein
MYMLIHVMFSPIRWCNSTDSTESISNWDELVEMWDSRFETAENQVTRSPYPRKVTYIAEKIDIWIGGLRIHIQLQNPIQYPNYN